MGEDKPRWKPRERLLRGEPVTQPLPISDALRLTPYRDPRMSTEPEAEAETRKRLDLAVRVGELLLRCGAGTRDVESSVVAVAAAAGVRRVEVDITNQSLLVQCPTSAGAPVTLLRVVRSSSRDFARLTAVHQLVDRLVSTPFDLDSAVHDLKQIQREPRLYPRWLVMLGYGGLAGGVATLLGGGSVAIVVAVLSSLAIDVLGRYLKARGLPAFYVAGAGGAAATVLAWAAYVLTRSLPGPDMSETGFAVAVSAGIVVLLPSRTLVAAVEDAITGYPVTGAGRMLTVVLTAAGIIVGVAAGLQITLRVDSALDLGLSTPQRLNLSDVQPQIVLAFAGGAVGAMSAALTMRSRPRMLLPTAGLGLGAVAVSQGLSRLVDVGTTTAVGAAAVGVGVIGRLLALRLGAPALVMVVPAVSPLLPGLRIFRGMYETIAGSAVGAHAVASPAAGVATLVGAAAVALAISTGVVLGDVLSAPFDRPIVQRRRARRR
ncbi:threonine/serine exporter family protein [Luteipulveratus flavus]|uniref:Threonine/serine exporter family protein n=1 Tax=Luteipulveratus flavus TaxID=3031728 RepID=A0ABT6CBT5_9MICO|nr:threonine/serine exporter family protein [Luteipulveratus sp. YIM 133296]MDF8266359.1 threonine/serine exporter family protein [Luteipulveratus sp. YIM 133296]